MGYQQRAIIQKVAANRRGFDQLLPEKKRIWAVPPKFQSNPFAQCRNPNYSGIIYLYIYIWDLYMGL